MSSAEQKENSLMVAYRRAADILKGADPRAICGKTGATFEDDSYRLTVLGSECKIQLPEVSFVTRGMPTIAEVLILHYLTSQDEKPVAGEFVSFRGIPGGMFYHQSFQQRAVDKLLSCFGQHPELLMKAATAFGGQKWTTGDHSSVIPVFPRIDIVVQIYEGDDEFPPEANILFSDNVVNFLPVEDTAFLGGWVVSALVRTAQ